jgi:hypothetical protein
MASEPDWADLSRRRIPTVAEHQWGRNDVNRSEHVMNRLIALGLAAALLTSCAQTLDTAQDSRVSRDGARTAAMMGYHGPFPPDDRRPDN